MSSLLYQLFTSTTLTTLSLSLYHLTTSIHTYLKSPTTFQSKPYHPLPLSQTSSPHLRRLPLYLTSLSLLTSLLYHLLSSTLTSPLFPTHPNLFLADIALSGSVFVQGLWAFQTGLSLYVDAFVPEGCHKLLDVVGGSTKCEVDEARVRAVAILDLMFVVYVVVVVLVLFVVYAVVGKVIGVGNRRLGSYEPLPNVAADGAGHVQLKALSGTQA